MSTEPVAYTEDVERQLAVLCEDYRRVEGKPFDHFFCPILFVDQRVPLCLGHVVNNAIPNSFGGRVVQRTDVDGFYGSMVEGDFTTKMQTLSMAPQEALLDPDISKKLRLTMLVDGEEWEQYPDRGQAVPEHHTRVTFHIGDQVVPRVLKKTVQEIDAVQDRGFELQIGKDCSLPALVASIKVAYLTLFKRLGYAYAFSEAGKAVGCGILGKFYKDHGHKRPKEALKEAPDFFRPYINMMRTIEGFTQHSLLGTVEDGQADLCLSVSGEQFALIVWIRTNKHYQAVLMPFYDDEKGVEVYADFLRNDNQQIRVHRCDIDNETKSCRVFGKQREDVWPKGDPSFSFE